MNTSKVSQYNYIPVNTYNSNAVFSQFERSMFPTSKPVVYNPEIKNNRKRTILTITGISATVITLALSLASRKFRLNATKLLENLKNTNEELLKHAKDTLSSKETPLLLRVKIHTLRFGSRVTNSVINFLSNLDHGKNYITGRVSNKLPLVDKIIGGLNSKLKPFFQNTVKSATIRKYNAADKAAIELQKTLSEIASRNSKASPLFAQFGDDIVNSVNNISKRTAFEGRTKELNSLLDKAVRQYRSEIEEMMKNPNVSKTANNLLNRTISLDLAKTKLYSHNLKLYNLKNIVTLTKKERVSALNNLLNEISFSTNVKPDAKLINNLTKAINEYSKHSTATNQTTLTNILQEVSAKINDPKVHNLVNNAKTAISGSKAGLVENLLGRANLALEKGIISNEEHKLLITQINKVKNTVNKAVFFEKENLAGRFLDINIGPVPFLETFSLSVPAAALAFDCKNAENKEERNSKLIQYAPAVAGGGLGWVYASLKGYFGFKALMFSLITGYAFNKLGIIIDDKYYSKGREFNTINMLTSENPEKQGLKVFEI